MLKERLNRRGDIPTVDARSIYQVPFYISILPNLIGARPGVVLELLLNNIKSGNITVAYFIIEDGPRGGPYRPGIY